MALRLGVAAEGVTIVGRGGSRDTCGGQGTGDDRDRDCGRGRGGRRSREGVRCIRMAVGQR